MNTGGGLSDSDNDAIRQDVEPEPANYWDSLRREFRLRFARRSSITVLVTLALTTVLALLCLFTFFRLIEGALSQGNPPALPNGAFTGMLLVAVQFWSKLLPAYAFLACANRCRRIYDTSRPMQSADHAFADFVGYWLALVVQLALAQLVLIAVYYVIDRYWPTRVPFDLSIVLLSCLYTVGRILLMGSIAACLTLWIGAGWTIATAFFVLFVQVCLQVITEQPVANGFFDVAGALQQSLDFILPWRMGFMWPLDANSQHVDSNAVQSLAGVMSQNLVYIVVCLSLTKAALHWTTTRVRVLVNPSL